MRKLNLKSFFKQKYLIFVLIPVFLLLGPIYVPIYIFYHTSNNNLTNLLIVNGIIQTPVDHPVEKQEQLWLSGWNYRKVHTIVGGTGGALTNYPIRIVVRYESGTDSGENVYCSYRCRADFGDIRFTKSDGITLLNYWMESKTDGDKATFWVKLDSIPASPGTANIYIYYGKGDATTTSSGDNTFTYFTDFPGTSLPAGWSQKCNDVGGFAVEDSLLKVWTDNTSHSPWQHQVIGYNVGYGYNICLLIKISYINQAPYKVVSVGLTSDNNTSDDWYDATHNIAAGGRYDDTHDEFITFEYNHITETILGIRFSSGDILELARAPSKCLFYQNHVLKSEHDSSFPSLPTGNLYIDIWGGSGGSSGGSGEIQIDWAAIRNYADPEPTHGAWGSQELGAEIWNDTIITDAQTIYGKVIILNGNLTIVNGGSLTLTSVTLMVNCTTNGEHGIEVQSGGALYINDTDGNPNTRSDATKIVAYNPDHKFNFWVDSGATFQMYNSELHCCGYWDTNYNRHGLWINADNTIIENNTFTNGFCGVILQNAHYNMIRNNNATNNTVGFYLYSSSYNTLTGNTAVKNSRDGFRLYQDNHHNTLRGNTAINNSNWGFVFSYSSYETVNDNTAINSGEWGFQLHCTTYSNFGGNNATNNGKDGFWIFSYSNNNFIKDNIAINNRHSGFYLQYVSGNTLENNTAINNSYGVYLEESSNNILYANKVINSLTQAYYSDGNSVNNDLTGSVKLNYLCVKVLRYIGNPMQGADVKIEVDGYTVYASPGFGGSNPTTDRNGLTGWVTVPYQTYVGGTWVNNISRVTVSSSELNITTSPRVINMSSTHRETFVLSNPPSYILSSYLPFLLFLMLIPSGFNPLVYLATALIVVAILTVTGLVLIIRREEVVPETKAPVKQWRTTTISRKIRCLYCGSEIPEDARFCVLCGKARARCSVCTDIISKDQFVKCPYCGAPSHRDHLLEWIKVKGYCPNCKKRLSRLDVI